MIRFFLLQNKQGQRRLSKWYANAPSDAERIKVEADIHRIIVLRDRKYTNFVEVKFAPILSSRVCN
jgi:AP-2 complex subunit sigma-1